MVDWQRTGKYVCSRMTWAVVLLQGAFLLCLWVTPTWSPPRVRWFELLWAWMHRATFYPFIALLIGGPVLTVAAAFRPGLHRLWLALAWGTFAVVVMVNFNDRVVAMARVVWWSVVG